MSDQNIVQFPMNDVMGSFVETVNASPAEVVDSIAETFAGNAAANELVMRAVSRRADSIAETHSMRAQSSVERLASAARKAKESADGRGGLVNAWAEYLKDASQRSVMMLDILRERGDVFIEHEKAGCPPVLVYDYEVILDGKDMERPSNYMLLKITPPKGVEVGEDRRPYIIIDPRAGHGGGIGGSKPDSQVGVALKHGHPVYFVAFRRLPEPGQTLADVCNTEAEFVREVQRRHPNSPKPVIVGNCQGGWASLVLAASNPDLTGPVVMNGAPVAPWSGRIGENPMRYNAGVLGGTWQPMFWSDVGGGLFDGAWLAWNFELLNPGRNYFRKYYDLYEKADTERERFIGFERWNGGFFLLNEPEIRWIVEQLFVGNRLVRNEARLEPGRPLDIKGIRAPIIVFASHGDNITPPQQALNWISETYADEEEITVRGQRIVYMIHDEVGHLGIFVSSKIAKKEHFELSSTMKTIEALAPGLYEMKIDAAEGEGADREFLVSFHERDFDDIAEFDDGDQDERPFAAVARHSEMQAQIYDVAVRPFVKAAVNPALAKAMQPFHPQRVQRWSWSSLNPFAKQIQSMCEAAEADRTPASPDNPFLAAERLWVDAVEQQMDVFRDLRDAAYETFFFSFWGAPWAQKFGEPNARHRAQMPEAERRALPQVQSALAHMSQGGFAEAVIRMLVLLAESRGSVRRDRLERSAQVLTQDEPFRSIPMADKSQMLHEQTLCVTFERERAIETLVDLLPDAEERRLAAEVVQYVPGPIDEMAPQTLETLQRMREVLGLPPATTDVTEDPLRKAGAKLAGTAAE